MDKVVTVNNLLIVGKTFSKLSILIHFGTLVVLFKSPTSCIYLNKKDSV